MSNDVKELAEALESLYEQSKTEELTIEEDGKEIFSDINDTNVVSDVEGMANTVLITSGGSVDYDKVSELRELGYRVYPGDKDSFGWLTGCIQKKGTNKILVFG